MKIKKIKTQDEISELKEGELLFLQGFEDDMRNKMIAKVIKEPTDKARGQTEQKWIKCLVASNTKNWSAEGDKNYSIYLGEYVIIKKYWKEISSYGKYNNKDEEEEMICKMKILFLN